MGKMIMLYCDLQQHLPAFTNLNTVEAHGLVAYVGRVMFCMLE